MSLSGVRRDDSYIGPVSEFLEHVSIFLDLCMCLMKFHGNIAYITSRKLTHVYNIHFIYNTSTYIHIYNFTLSRHIIIIILIIVIIVKNARERTSETRSDDRVLRTALRVRIRILNGNYYIILIYYISYT